MLTVLALITISTRASLKRYHSYTLSMGLGESGDEWQFQRIGTSAEKSSVEKELTELRERLAKVEEWKERRQEIEDELNRVWTSGGEELPPPAYAEKQSEKSEEKNKQADQEAKGVRILEDSRESILTAGSNESL
jgi:ATP-binding cassette subfamily D (ALD) long-chain fatty acid import protein